MAPYRIGEVPVFTADMEAFNSAMSSARASVEWLFGDISNSFKFLDFKKNLKLGLSAVGKQYIVSALFRNILTCLYGNTTSTHFNLIHQLFKTIWPNGITVYQVEMSEPDAKLQNILGCSSS